MKKLTKMSLPIIAVVLIAFSCLQAFAETIYEYYGISYVIVTNTELTVVGWDNRSSELIIPNQINGRNIISINNGALEGNSVVTTVDFSKAKALKRIGSYAFQDCIGLNEPLVLTESITTIENRAFQNCSSIPFVTIKSKITEIPNQCFMGCSSIEKVELTEGIERINAWSFADCNSLEYINIPKSVSFISDYAFDNCPNLVLGVYKGTYALQYAEENEIDHIILDGDKIGDVNGDGVVDILDATEIQKYAAESTDFTDEQFELGDINKDGYCDVIDALLVQKSVIGAYELPQNIIRY